MRPARFFITFFILIFATLSWRALAVQAVALAWNPSPSPRIIGYNVRYGRQSGIYTSVVRCGMKTTATISGLVEGLTYYFAATATTASGSESPPSNEASYLVPGIAPPGAPWIQNQNGVAVLKWNRSPSANVTGYDVYFGVTSASQPLLLFSGNATQFGPLQKGYYAVTACNVFGQQSARSASVQCTAGPGPTAHANGRAPSNAAPALQLDFDSPHPLQAGGLTFTLRRSGNLAGHIEYSTNLLDWVRWTNFAGAETTITFRDPDAARSPRRFYRAVVP